MLKLLLILWFATYCKTVCNNFLVWQQTKKALKKLAAFAVAYKFSEIPRVREDYSSELTDVLLYYPVIKRLAGTPGLSYSQTDKENYEAARSLAYNLQMQQNEAWYTFLHSLNPIMSAKEIVLLPVSLLRELGFSPNKFWSVFWTGMCPLLPTLVDMFQSEIKTFLTSVFEKFIG